MYGLILFVFGLDIEIDGTSFMIVLYISLVAVMLLFDFVLRRIALLYERRIRSVVFRNMR